MISKIESALQELEETVYWMELLVESEIIKKKRLDGLMNEADEIIAILVISIKTLKNSNETLSQV